MAGTQVGALLLQLPGVQLLVACRPVQLQEVRLVVLCGLPNPFQARVVLVLQLGARLCRVLGWEPEGHLGHHLVPRGLEVLLLLGPHLDHPVLPPLWGYLVSWEAFQWLLAVDTRLNRYSPGSMGENGELA
jgi:hypothetical protein